MTNLREAAQMHIEDLKKCIPTLNEYGLLATAAEFQKAIDELSAALAQPEPKELAQLEQAMIEAWKPIPQREWIGLTEMEVMDICNFAKGQNGFFFVREVEAKLKEKNGNL